MLLGIFSDVHANVEALNAVLEHARRVGVERYVCLGDVVGYGADPNACCDIVRRVASVTILGNHDAAVSGRIDNSYYYAAARRALDLHARVLTPQNMAWLKSLELSFDFEGVGFCHGSPVAKEEFRYIYLREQAEALLPYWEDLPEVTFIGHSHLCKIFALTPHDVEEVMATDIVVRRGNKYIISTGSVGQPRDYDNRSCLATYDTVERRFVFHRVEYPIEIAAQKIFESDLEPDFGRRLFLGV
jgi:diadenosine tetraphosphatase ApaH/serine/threonine PP2A family protein phosphatase